MKKQYQLTNGRILEILPDDDPVSPREYDNLGSFFTWHDRWAPGGYIADRRRSISEQLVMAIQQQYQKDIEEAWKARGDAELQHQMRRNAESLPRQFKCIQGLRGVETLEALQQVAIIVPIYMYEHSGMTISINPFSDPWDSGQVGFYFMTKGRAWHEWGYPLTKARREKAIKCLEAEIAAYDQYLTGDVWGFQIIDAEDKETDSCWGFYGDDIKTNGILDHLSEEDRALVLKEL